MAIWRAPAELRDSNPRLCQRTNQERQLIAIVTAVAELATAPDYRGCTLRNTYTELAGRDHPAHRVIVEHYTSRLAQLHALAERAQAQDPGALAAKIALIIDGLNANGAILGARSTADAATALAREVVAAATARDARPVEKSRSLHREKSLGRSSVAVPRESEP
jgi:hypothetical protein